MECVAGHSRGRFTLESILRQKEERNRRIFFFWGGGGWGSEGGLVVRALALHSCGMGSYPSVDVICRFRLLFVPSLAQRGISPTKFQFDMECMDTCNSIWPPQLKL